MANSNKARHEKRKRKNFEKRQNRRREKLEIKGINVLFDNTPFTNSKLTDEAMADVSAQIFGNQDFIKNIEQSKPNVFQKNYNEVEYNSAIEEELGKQEYAILKNIINSDSNIKPGINYIDVTNGRYTVYYKDFDEFKVMSRKVDKDAERINPRNDTTRRKNRYSRTSEQFIGNERTTTSNDEISNSNTKRTRKRSGSDTGSSTNIENVKYSIQESENNAGSFNLPISDKLSQLINGMWNQYLKDTSINASTRESLKDIKKT